MSWPPGETGEKEKGLSGMLLMARNEDETKGKRGVLTTQERATVVTRQNNHHGGPNPGHGDPH